ETAADPAGHLGGDHAGARAEKRVIDRLAGPAVVDDRAAHAFDRLLGAVPPARLPQPAAERVVVGDLPNRGLRAVALPMAGLALAHRVPAGLMLPMIIAAAQGEVLLGPDDLRPRLEAASSETGGCDPASTEVTAAALVLSPQPTRWSPNSQRSPSRVTGCSGISGTLSGSLRPLDLRPLSTVSSWSGSKPIRPRSKSADPSACSSLRSKSRSQPARAAN